MSELSLILKRILCILHLVGRSQNIFALLTVLYLTTTFKTVAWMGRVDMSYPYTILVGNSPNLLVNLRPHEVSWEGITRKLEESCVRY